MYSLCGSSWSILCLYLWWRSVHILWLSNAENQVGPLYKRKPVLYSGVELKDVGIYQAGLSHERCHPFNTEQGSKYSMIAPVTDYSHPPMQPVFVAFTSIILGNPNLKGFGFSSFPILSQLSLQEPLLLNSMNLVFEVGWLISCLDVSVSISGSEETTTYPLKLCGICSIAHWHFSLSLSPHFILI